MNIKQHQRWALTPAEAVVLQHALRGQISLRDEINTVHTVAGIDVGFEDDGKVTRAAVVILMFPTLELIEYRIARLPTTFPYIPGLLSFRELPAVLEAMAKLSVEPDLLLCDGQGYAHPRHFGMACHLGLVCNIPSIGVGKSRLIGTHAPVADRRGACQPLLHQNEKIGAVLRTRQNVKPVYVSIGHRISMATAIKYVLACAPRFRLPETTRLAHRYASL